VNKRRLHNIEKSYECHLNMDLFGIVKYQPAQHNIKLGGS